MNIPIIVKNVVEISLPIRFVALHTYSPSSSNAVNRIMSD